MRLIVREIAIRVLDLAELILKFKRYVLTNYIIIYYTIPIRTQLQCGEKQTTLPCRDPYGR